MAKTYSATFAVDFKVGAISQAKTATEQAAMCQTAREMFR